ncbi:putative orphan protein [Photobacterium sp. SKA34]|uniref:hypothetical protein n=1 Tax=Photobacterium sp. SKA34 TaxID=121723 RepID=UPI00006BEB38|nr:hypothetical protein [Photobacterium sp. SKA34]EAR55868.1 putative orphan protein [Photobacterium sp. SKA34]
MNIESKLQQLRKVRKLRAILLFHRRQVGGIDVSKEQYSDVQVFVKALFKQLKVQKFDIQVTHWGEIYLIEPARDIHIRLSINYKVNIDDIEQIKLALKLKGYIAKEVDGFAREQLCVSFCAYRPGTKWRRYPLETKLANYDELVTQIITAMKFNVAQLSATVRHELSKDIHQINLEDVMALICYGAAKLGPDSQLAHLSNNKELRSPISCKLLGHQLMLFGYYCEQHEFFLSPSSMKIFRMLLPEVSESEAEFV